MLSGARFKMTPCRAYMAVFNLGRTREGMDRQELVLMERFPGRASHTTALRTSEEESETKSK